MALKVGKKKTISSDFVHRWRGGAKCLTSKGGFGRTPRTPPGSAPEFCYPKLQDISWSSEVPIYSKSWLVLLLGVILAGCLTSRFS